jgi:UDP-galactopyranose mutase
MTVTISEEEFEYLQRCRSTVEFLGHYVGSRVISIDKEWGAAFPVFNFELRGRIPLRYRTDDDHKNDTTPEEGYRALDLSYLNNPPAKQKLIKGE